MALILCISIPAVAVADETEYTHAYFTYYTAGVGGGSHMENLDETKSGDGWSFDADSYTLPLNGFEANNLCIYNATKPLTLKLADGSTNKLVSNGLGLRQRAV